MQKQIGAVLARTFREECEKSNKLSKKDFSFISTEEITAVEQILKNIDQKNSNFEEELKRYFKLD